MSELILTNIQQKHLFWGTILAREIIVVRFDKQFLFWPKTYKSIINNFLQFAKAFRSSTNPQKAVVIGLRKNSSYDAII